MIQKRPRTRTCRKKNENSTTTVLEELASEAVSSSQRKRKNEVDDDGERAEDVEKEEGNKKEVEEDKGKQKEVEEEEVKNKQVVEEEEEQINEVDEDKGKQKGVEEEEQEKNEVEDDGIKTISAHTFPMHLYPNATGDTIMRREFAIVSGLKCHPPSEPVLEFTVKKEPWRRKKGGKEETRQSTEKQDLMSLVGTSFKNSDLIFLLNVEDIPRKHKESLCVLWFVHNLLLAKDLNNNISLKWVNLSQDIEAFNNYPWGHESFELTVKYLLKPLGPKTNNLFGFPCAFMAWAFETIPHLTYQVVHPWLVPKEKELQMSYLITLGLVETLFDPVVDRVKMELSRERTIKRDRVINELVVFDGVDGRGIDAGTGACAGQDQGATSCRRCSSFLCE
ncbi:hypothetical protein KY285_026503 [Solanum tuberosum]|nr:hypothetical protein KY285_026503 [Solanum tuberosum]